MRDIIRSFLRRADVDALRAESFRDFHAPGVDYFCLHRSPEFTAKLYRLPVGDGNLVHPHSHRYEFHTWVLRGCIANVVYEPADVGGELWRQWLYRSPLNGGPAEFHYDGVRRLAEDATILWPGQSYHFTEKGIHTLRVHEPSVVLLFQFADKPEPDTLLFTKFTEDRPSLDGLYRRFGASEFRSELASVLNSIGVVV